MDLISKHIRHIINANNDNSLAIFVGAGISMSSNTNTFKLPSWNDLIHEMKVELDEENENDYLKLAQLYYLAFGEFSYYKKIKNFFPEFIKPSIVHKLIFELNPHIIITTNWDTILERTIEENAFIYDTICSDNDLVKSSIQNKLIKMHGDFKNHNIVFKEDDYINYQYNFPLIENFVKSILSTHTVLFLGYSYNDINLKQILKWIKNHSDVRPPMYLTTFSNNISQNKYLENHGIRTLILNDQNESFNGLDSYSIKMSTFLHRIKNLDEELIVGSEDYTINFILKKLDSLKSLNGILLEQVKNTLTNCSFIYDNDSKPILELFVSGAINSKSKVKQLIFRNFIDILVKTDRDKAAHKNIKTIFEILNKANIKGIVISNQDLNSNLTEYIPFKEHIFIEEPSFSIYYDFNFKNISKSSNDISQLMDLAFKLYQLELYEESFGFLEEVISICLKQRNYTILFIAMFNRNIILNKLKSTYTTDRNKYFELEDYNLKERFSNLPKDLQLALEPLYDIIDFSFIYKYAFELTEELRKKEETKRIIESGGMVLNSQVNRLESKHENLVHFVLKNNIMIESFNEYRNINKHFIQISIIRQIQKEKTTLNRLELFSTIKYLKNEDIKLLFNEFYSEDSEKKGAFHLSDENTNWLAHTVLGNIVNQFLNSKNTFGNYEKYLENVLLVLSLVELNKNQLNNILKKIKELLSEGNNTFGIFQAINLFLGIQYNLYKTKIDEKVLINLIEDLINKIIYKNYNRHEYRAITRNELSNLYGYAKERKAIFVNKSLIDKLIVEIDNYQISDTIELSQNLLFRIYDISNKQIQGMIKKFILAIDSSDEKEEFKRIVFELTLIIYEFKSANVSLIEWLNNFMDQFKDGKQFSSYLYMIDSQIDFLIKNKSLTEFKTVSSDLKQIIENFNNSSRLSII
jgi:hypothetical protein